MRKPEYRLTVPGAPIPQPRPRAVVMPGPPRKGKPCGCQARVHPLTHVKRDGQRVEHPIVAFRAAVRLQGKIQIPKPIAGPVKLSILFLMPRPLKIVWKTRPMPRIPAISKRNDWDNLSKAVCDALNGVAWEDDGQIWDAQVQTLVCAGDEEPQTQIWIRESAE